ncbi:hypothetical protein KPG71_17050 [Roseovarius sp. PS-C2]|uniref:hypothetical protein n=1 Tax=Roseovarius sp. PS-C2 TaxID=2820814 RepID=UPI001C0B6C1C|nr:hypothetical protein [Roseovarius sp. PS-C2]MBU3261737.1 hypothetical protein [Roseovarius sp. PS-C2]
MSEIVSSKPVRLSSAQMTEIKSEVTQDFLDPFSAQFRNIRAVDVSLANGQQERRVCGEVNGKNRMGGYVGFSMFGGVIVNGDFQQRDFFSPCENW